MSLETIYENFVFWLQQSIDEELLEADGNPVLHAFEVFTGNRSKLLLTMRAVNRFGRATVLSSLLWKVYACQIVGYHFNMTMPQWRGIDWVMDNGNPTDLCYTRISREVIDFMMRANVVNYCDNAEQTEYLAKVRVTHPIFDTTTKFSGSGDSYPTVEQGANQALVCTPYISSVQSAREGRPERSLSVHLTMFFRLTLQPNKRKRAK